MTDPSDSGLLNSGLTGETSSSLGSLMDLLLIHQRQWWASGERALVETYLRQHPALRDDSEAVLDLIYNEMILREEVDDAPRLAEYLERFPELGPQLTLQFELEEALRPSPFLKDGDGISPMLSSPVSAPRGRQAVAVADYEILGILGRGGMGIVYKARQTRLNRIVALKMILAGDHASPEASARFLAEAEAVARLQHPNIVRVFACGDHDGLPYFAMEYVAGGSLADQLDGTPRPARASAELVATLAQAMGEAHSLGIVHRDLKPANILMTEDGIPKIADFGLAKTLQVLSSLTGTHAIIGSPSYMAPEQAGGPPGAIGPTTDVYALGAILYELLTGRPPFTAESPLETLDQIREREPVPPSRLVKKIPRDLETICLTCLRKERSRRYADTDALVDDLGRFLSDKPILARRVKWVEHAWRWCRREPVLAGLGGGLLLALVLGIGGIMTQWQRAERHLKEARLQRQRAEMNFQRQWEANKALRVANEREGAARHRAQDRFDAAMKVLHVFDLAMNNAAVLRDPLMEGTRGQLLQASLALCRELQGTLEENASGSSRTRLSDAYTRVGYLSSSLGLFNEALTARKRSQALVEQIVAETPSDVASRSTLAIIYVDIGILLNVCYRPAEALGSFEQARRVQEALIRERPNDLRERERLSWTLGNIGASHLSLGRPAEAARMHEKVLEIREALLAKNLGSLRYQSNLAWCLLDLGLAREASGEISESLRLLQRATAIQAEVQRRDPALVEYRKRLAKCLDAVGRLLLRLGRAGDAAGPLERSASLIESLVQDHPALYRDDLVRSYIKIAMQRASVDQPGEMRASFQRAEAILGRLPLARPGTLYDLACGYSYCANFAPNSERSARAELALEKLRQAVAAGYRDVETMRRDPDLDPIRSYAGFHLLLMDLSFPDDPFLPG
ncbi:protein kinase domain-containing protein [Singulisphaera acidiphila]|uniref:Serine/threonine protein kinase n=1 Tax=Singulisphaera acidiphila (strain ATCC BAA-1392 / DSM 18658 / VKM B-2454 / MOB10) TaxID=886293 RepID=L0DJE6_SINAD|nr:serine/threonine-protein kinase [Singulisphaera acidiphila]AGA29367.1 serine/threonine protein kinase [Singulisphaera acidiphila DSM 18658]